MPHHFRRAVNLTFAFLLAVFSVNLSGVLALQNAYADPGQGNPGGNNGTVKIGELDVDNGNANDPHVGCTLEVKFFGYDTGTRSGTVTFEAQAPTQNQLVSPIGPQAVTFTGSGVGNNLDYTKQYTLAFSGAPQQNQGYHVKATMTVDGAQGNDTKHKTFWVEGCEPTPSTPSATATPGPCIQPGTSNGTVTIVVANTDDASNNSVEYTVTVPGKTSKKITVADGQTGNVNFTNLTAESYMADIVGSDGTSTTTSFSIITCPTTPVVPSVPEFIDKCQTANDSYKITATEGVTYKVNNTATSDGTYNASFWDYINGVTITAHADSGYTLTNYTGPWKFKFTNAGCPASATKPTLVNECGTHNDRFVIPEIEGVQYKVSKFGIIYLNVDAGSHWAEGTFYVKAVAKPGYTLTGNTNSWTLYLDPSLCGTDADTVFVDECGTTKDAFTIKAADHVTYKIATKWVWFIVWIPVEFEEIAPGTYTDEANGRVKIIADADQGYYVQDDWFWIHDFNSDKCELPAVGDPTFTDECGADNDAYTIVPAANVTYKVNGTVTTAGLYPNATGIVEITAEATDPDYVLADPTAWSHNFSNATCADITAVALCDRTGVIVTLANDGDTDGTAMVNGDAVTVPANDKVEVTVPLTLFKANVLVTVNDMILVDKAFDCTPGMGGGGFPGPIPPVVVTPAGITLPQTGSDTNALMQLLTVVTAGLVTYGGVFYLVNRRNLFNNR